VAALSQLVLDGSPAHGHADACLLYTELRNSTSNRVYRRLGYRSVAEVLAYEFDRG
jgi:predicted GNAT family acetyltransferase